MTLLDITSALRAFINQRPGFEPGNYAGAPAAYRADYRKCLRDRDDALYLLSACERATDEAGMTKCLLDSLKSGRLTMLENGALDYTTGQYFPTEYRAAACGVLARALWDYARPWNVDGDAEKMRKSFRMTFGRRIASRWFA